MPPHDGSSIRHLYAGSIVLPHTPDLTDEYDTLDKLRQEIRNYGYNSATEGVDEAAGRLSTFLIQRITKSLWWHLKSEHPPGRQHSFALRINEIQKTLDEDLKRGAPLGSEEKLIDEARVAIMKIVAAALPEVTLTPPPKFHPARRLRLSGDAIPFIPGGSARSVPEDQ
ncbi:hypothetical protein JCM10212_002606 [Sporobolomyces blumeae]